MMNAQELLKNTVILSYSIHGWGNRGKADNSKIQSEAEKKRLHVTKQLVDSPEYKAIKNYQGEVNGWLKYRSVPAFFKNALVLVKTDVVSDFESKLNDATAKIKELTEVFVKVYPDQKEAAKIALGNIYAEKDYPTANELRESFDITWNWIELNVAENLPNDIRKKEGKKLEELWESSIKEIIMSLRTGFQELVDHAVDRLTVAPGEKPRIFKDTLIPNFKLFIDTFSARNVVNDTELEKLVEQARKLIDGVSTKDFRDDTKLRDYTARKFAELKKTVDESVTTISRKFDFDDK